jgi:hypothetical protein
MFMDHSLLTLFTKLLTKHPPAEQAQFIQVYKREREITSTKEESRTPVQVLQVLQVSSIGITIPVHRYTGKAGQDAIQEDKYSEYTAYCNVNITSIGT